MLSEVTDICAQVIFLDRLKSSSQPEVPLDVVKIAAIGPQRVVGQANRRSTMFQELFARFCQCHGCLAVGLKAASFDDSTLRPFGWCFPHKEIDAICPQ